MSKVLTADFSSKSKRKDFADQLREFADQVENELEGEPVAFAAIVFNGAPWEEAVGSLARWHLAWPKGVFVEAVKLELLSNITSYTQSDIL